MPKNPWEKEWEVVREFRRSLSKAVTVVFTNGCYDLFHAGHVESLEFAKRAVANQYLTCLIVGVNDDAGVRRLKGSGRPINDLMSRMQVLKACRFVDICVPFSEDAPERLIRAVEPNIIVKDAWYRRRYVAGGDWVKKHGGKVMFAPTLKGVSTTEILKRGGSNGG
ncbi:MAG TPA: adenylyltransferase/cytidyltransferase family protein [Candidatus Heimdallarchaeota archaeon]|nr:adenylyltransferase/cytidyltransferase family protein [Candidatus Heimdallarchaeota archaeon]